MMAELWGDIEQDLTNCRRHLSTAVDLFGSRRFETDDATRYFDEMAFMHMMQSGYTSLEAAMKRLLGLLGEELPKGSDWHADLLRRLRSPVAGARPEIIDETLFRAADGVRRFRHVAMHNYDYFDEARAALAVKDAETVLADIGPALARFRAMIDPD